MATQHLAAEEATANRTGASHTASGLQTAPADGGVVSLNPIVLMPSPIHALVFPREEVLPVSAMWKSSESSPATVNPPEEAKPLTPRMELAGRGALHSAEQATIGKGIYVAGEITGSESLFVDGKIEGSISLPGSRVTVGRDGNINATISAREIVILGKVRGNVSATDRVEIRAEGSLTGDVTAARISIEDGAFFKGGIDIRRSEAKGNGSSEIGSESSS
jgi:cytoskeletal protein CcmA (bactofilin family)